MHQPVESDTPFFLLLDIARMLRAEFEHEVREADLGVTPGEARTLANIARFGPLSQNDLAELSGFGAMSVTRVIKNLETAGLIYRSIDPNDRRAKMVQISDKATPLMHELKKIEMSVKDITSRNVTSKNWRAFEQILKVVRDNHLTAYHGRRAIDIETE
tara:strand:- start:480 stop:956 length:477 start_codon:yes stop_codon:yes gene_type:complete